MMKERNFFADTSFLIDLFKGENRAEKIRKSGSIVTGVVVLYELHKLASFNRSRLGQNTVLDLNEKDVQEAARLYKELSSQGEKIGEVDYLIAGQASNRDLTLVTRNSHFEKIEGLDILKYQL